MGDSAERDLDGDHGATDPERVRQALVVLWGGAVVSLLEVAAIAAAFLVLVDA